MSQDSLDAKARKWNSLQSKRFGSAKKTAFVDTGKQSLPAEHVRKIIKVSTNHKSLATLPFSTSPTQLTRLSAHRIMEI